MAITYFNSSSNPTDNGTLAGAPVSVTPPGSMVTGDLVFIIGQSRDATAGPSHNLSIGTTGGQTWTTEAQNTNTTSSQQTRIFWCRYNGTWSADPAVTVSQVGNPLTVVMHVFRPTSGSNTWAIDVAQTNSTYTAPSSPFTVTITGQTTVASSTVTLTVWTSSDDNTWGTLSGSGWNVAGGAQYRNLSGSDQSMTFAYFISTSASTATGNVSQNQATLGGDPGNTHIITLKEVSSTTTSTSSSSSSSSSVSTSSSSSSKSTSSSSSSVSTSSSSSSVSTSSSSSSSSSSSVSSSSSSSSSSISSSTSSSTVAISWNNYLFVRGGGASISMGERIRGQTYGH